MHGTGWKWVRSRPLRLLARPSHRVVRPTGRRPVSAGVEKYRSIRIQCIARPRVTSSLPTTGMLFSRHAGDDARAAPGAGPQVDRHRPTAGILLASSPWTSCRVSGYRRQRDQPLVVRARGAWPSFSSPWSCSWSWVRVLRAVLAVEPLPARPRCRGSSSWIRSLSRPRRPAGSWRTSCLCCSGPRRTRSTVGVAGPAGGSPSSAGPGCRPGSTSRPVFVDLQPAGRPQARRSSAAA